MRPTSESPALVSGATGGQGGAVVDALLAHGVRVRSLLLRSSSDWAQHTFESRSQYGRGPR